MTEVPGVGERGVRTAPRPASGEKRVASPETPVSSPSSDAVSGEALYEKARALPHQSIPDFAVDGEYLELLGKSAATGFPPALAKLGEYAMRRAAWVEAYYWMTMARRNGMHGLSPVLDEICRNWVNYGCPDQAGNENELFSLAAGSLARALLHRDSGYDADAACEFLKANCPDFA